MAGNVWEWVSDRYGARAYKKLAKKNPSGPAKGNTRVVRGCVMGQPDQLGKSVQPLSPQTHLPEQQDRLPLRDGGGGLAFIALLLNSVARL